jgi:hypothetical protein
MIFGMGNGCGDHRWRTWLCFSEKSNFIGCDLGIALGVKKDEESKS